MTGRNARRNRRYPLRSCANTAENRAEFSGDGSVGDNLGLGRSPGFVASSLENDRVLAGLGGVLVLEEGRNGASRVAVSGEIASSGETVSSGEITILQ